MIFIGVDHGTTGIRFACISEGASEAVYELSREDAAGMSTHEIMNAIEKGLNISFDDVGLVALTYSMGDGISYITDIRSVPMRGLREEETAAGKRVGGGTRVFDAFRSSDMPVVLIPGIHADLECVDWRMRFLSHGASPDKVCVAYHIFKRGYRNFVFADISSNTVSVAVAEGRIKGAIDACIFAPGLIHGPLDLQLLRDVERGRMSANEAFSNAGVLRKFGFRRGIERDKAFETIALFAAMEISALLVFLRSLQTHSSPQAAHVFLTGSVGEGEWMRKRISEILKSGWDECRVHKVSKNSAAIGCAEIARDVFNGEVNILGIPVCRQMPRRF